MKCNCGHMPYHHMSVRGPCDICLRCGRGKPGPGRECCLTPKRCPCNGYEKAAD